MTDTNKERAEFEAWYASTDDAPAEPDHIYEFDEDGMNELTKGCIWLGWQARAAKAPAAPQGDGDMLRAHAEGRVTHINNGLCPDIIEGHDTRDPECPVCQALLENHAALPAPPQGAAKEQK